MNKKIRDGKINLNPQAAGYYKRLMLVSDRYYLLVKKLIRIRITLWTVVAIAIVQMLVILNTNGMMDRILSVLEKLTGVV